MNADDINPDDYQMRAFEYGLQYLVAGRFSVASGFSQTSANLLHHAIELLLKGCLVEHVGLKNLPRGRDGHNLNALWSKFREHFSDESLERFTPVINDLDKFEHIRYPENLVAGGGLFGVGFPSGARHKQLTGEKSPEYQISVEDVDELVQTLFKLSNINTKICSSLFEQEHAHKYYTFRNKYPFVKKI